MSYAAIHPDWEKPRRNMADGYSLEMTAKELEGLREAAPLIRPNTQVTMDFRADRLNIDIDASDIITGFRCT